MPSAYKVPMASDVLPEPDTPTTATVRQSGTSTSTSRRLLCRAPRTPITVGRVPGSASSVITLRVYRPARALVQAQRLHDLESRGQRELLDIGSRKHAAVLGDNRPGRLLGDGIEMTLDPGPDVLAVMHVVRHRVDARQRLPRAGLDVGDVLLVQGDIVARGEPAEVAGDEVRPRVRERDVGGCH